ncbi:MAG: UbiA family prenyltransferase [Candidatus Aenigmatarchaeota archaeon]
MLRKYLSLIRVSQWYKNLLIFLPLIFAAQMYNLESLLITSFGFVSLCLISSASYIINDIIDRKKDQAHPEKSYRMIASGRIKPSTGFIISLFLLAAGIGIASALPESFLYASAALFLLTMLYTLYLKREPFADIIAIAVNFVIRAVAGALAINVRISPWLILCTFFLSLLISIGKRKADLAILKNKAIHHKEVYRHYDDGVTNSMMITATVALIMSYSLYSFLSIYEMLILSLPFALYVIFRYSYLVHAEHLIARRPEKFYKDSRLAIGIFLWMISVFLIIY